MTKSAIALAMCFIFSGCSLALVKGPSPRGARAITPMGDCTTEKTVPYTDFVIGLLTDGYAIWNQAKAKEGEDGFTNGLLVGLGLGFIAGGLHGRGMVNDCVTQATATRTTSTMATGENGTYLPDTQSPVWTPGGGWQEGAIHEFIVSHPTSFRWAIDSWRRH